MSVNLIKSSIATVQNGVARADGKLQLTESEVIFEPFNQELGLGPYQFKRAEIAAVGKCLGKGGGIIPITTEAIRITLHSEQVYEFIIAQPSQWIAFLAGNLR